MPNAHGHEVLHNLIYAPKILAKEGQVHGKGETRGKDELDCAKGTGVVSPRHSFVDIRGPGDMDTDPAPRAHERLAERALPQVRVTIRQDRTRHGDLARSGTRRGDGKDLGRGLGRQRGGKAVKMREERGLAPREDKVGDAPGRKGPDQGSPGRR